MTATDLLSLLLVIGVALLILNTARMMTAWSVLGVLFGAWFLVLILPSLR